jgi:FkbM family methyltransferase
MFYKKRLLVKKQLWQIYKITRRLIRRTGLQEMLCKESDTFSNCIGNFIDRFLLPKSEQVITIWENIRVYNTAITPEMLFDDYESTTRSLLQHLLRPGMIFVDVGAHVGLYTLLAALLVGSSGKVYAFEPDPANIAALTKNIRLNNFRNVIVIPHAVSNVTGNAIFYINKACGALSSLYRPSPFPQIVQTVTIDDFFAKEGGIKIDLMKIDVEGSEYNVLLGATETLKRSVRLIIEFNPRTLRCAGVLPEKLIELLWKMGYNINVIGSDHLIVSELQVKRLIYNLSHGEGHCNLYCWKEQKY